MSGNINRYFNKIITWEPNMWQLNMSDTVISSIRHNRFTGLRVNDVPPWNVVRSRGVTNLLVSKPCITYTRDTYLTTVNLRVLEKLEYKLKWLCHRIISPVLRNCHLASLKCDNLVASLKCETETRRIAILYIHCDFHKILNYCIRAMHVLISNFIIWYL